MANTAEEIQDDWRILGDSQSWMKGLALSRETWHASPLLMHKTDRGVFGRKFDEVNRDVELAPGDYIIEGGWDHEHCAFCMGKITEGDEAYHAVREAEGYEGAQDGWVCPECFNDFREHFGWLVSDERS